MSEKRWVAFSRAVALTLVAGSFLLGPIASAVAQEWNLGSKRFLTNAAVAAAPLRIVSTGYSDLSTFRFVGRVGGVSFIAVAQPDQTATGKSIDLAYDPALPDGSRLVVRVDSKALRTSIPDWQLRPIVEFAASEFNAVVSLFGEGPEGENYYYIQYHDAMKDTLMGMRLLHADILFIALDEHWRLPRYGGKVVLGAGEQDPSEGQSMKAKARLQAALRDQKWRSWVLTDAGTRPTFGVANGELVIRAQPYYYFWNADERDIDANRQARNRMIDEHNKLVRSARASLDQYNALVPLYNSSTDPDRRRTLRNQLDALKSEYDKQEERLGTLRLQIESDKMEPKVYEVAALTNAMRSLDQVIGEYNPPVYRAFQRLAQYAAFFRYVKNSNPSGWKTFQRAVAGMTIQPSVKTPTAWAR